MTTKEKILLKAKELFFSIGYDNTSIQRIIDDVGIAKGTFYHHYKSKEQLLEDLTDMIVLNEVKPSIDYVNQSNDDATTKFNRFINKQTEWKSGQFELLYVLLKAMYLDENITLRNMLYQKNIDNFGDIFTKIIDQGIAEGTFKTPYPETMGKMIFKISNNESEEIANVMLNYKNYSDPAKVIIDKYNVLLHSIERLLGAKEGTFRFEDTGIITAFIEYLRERDEKL